MAFSPVGAPNAAIQLEEPRAHGVRRFVAAGTAGSLPPDPDVGEMVLCTGLSGTKARRNTTSLRLCMHILLPRGRSDSGPHSESPVSRSEQRQVGRPMHPTGRRWLRSFATGVTESWP